MHACMCVFSSLVLPSERPCDIPIAIGIPSSQVFDSKYNTQQKKLGSLEKCLILGEGGKHKVGLEHLIQESKAILKEW